MTGRTHDMFALTGLIVVGLAYPPEQLTLGTVVAVLVANQLGGIAPDIDEPGAPFWRNLPLAGFMGKTVSRLLGGHRFLTHSLLGVFLTGILLNWFLQLIHPIMPRIDMTLVWWAFMIGLVSHLVIDSFSKEGVPWLLPLPFKLGFPPVRSWRMTTGENVETYILFPALLIFNIVYCMTHYQQILEIVHLLK